MNGMDVALHRLALRIYDPDASDLQVCDIAFFEINDLVRRSRKCQCVRGEEIFSLTHTYHQR